MRNMQTSILLGFVQVLNYIIPKDKKNIVFYSLPDFTDNCRAIYEELVRLGKDKEYNITWVVRNVKKYQNDHPGIKFVRHRSLGSLWAYCRARYIIRTHSYWGNRYLKERQIMCIAWHGMPIKREYNPNKPISAVKCDLLISTAEVFSKELSLAMGLDNNECMETGLPRNDDLFKKTDIKSRMGFGGFDKVIIWMPTFRKGLSMNDGVESKFGLPTVEDGGLEEINAILKEKNYLLILKLHPFAADKLSGLIFSNIVNIKDTDIPKDASLYELIGQTDALITDYSSISVDYLLIDKPICFVIDDIEEYRRTRGFSLEPIENYFAGNKIKDFSQLKQWFSNFDGEDEYMEERKKMKELFHKHCDNRSSERVLRELGIVI